MDPMTMFLMLTAAAIAFSVMGVDDWDPPAAGTTLKVGYVDFKSGIETGMTDHYGTSDPGFSGAADLGKRWRDANNDPGNGGDELGSLLMMWSVLTAAPTFGLRDITPRIYIPLEPNVVVLDDPAQSTTAFGDLDLTSDTSARAIAVRLMVTAEDSGTPGDAVYAGFRKNGTTTDARERRVHPQAAAKRASVIVEVELDSAQTFEYEIAASGAGTFDLRIDVLGYYERG